MWQFISGGGEDSELPIEAAIRESFEEAQIKNRPFYKLDTTSSIPTYWFKAHANKPNLYLVPEYCFAVELDSKDIVLSDEHSEFEFCDYKKASELLRFDNNKTALWELRKRLERNDLKEV
jgi:dATP pyrophosphohydrolase